MSDPIYISFAPPSPNRVINDVSDGPVNYSVYMEEGTLYFVVVRHDIGPTSGQVERVRIDESALPHLPLLFSMACSSLNIEEAEE